MDFKTSIIAAAVAALVAGGASASGASVQTVESGTYPVVALFDSETGEPIVDGRPGLAAGLAMTSVGHAADGAAAPPTTAAAEATELALPTGKDAIDTLIVVVAISVAEKVAKEVIGAAGDILRCDIGAGEKSLWRVIGLPRLKC